MHRYVVPDDDEAGDANFRQYPQPKAKFTSSGGETATAEQIGKLPSPSITWKAKMMMAELGKKVGVGRKSISTLKGFEIWQQLKDALEGDVCTQRRRILRN